MGIERKKLDRVFGPESVAFIGATEGSVKWGFVIFNNIIAGGFQGRLYPVNPGRETVMGLRCYPSVCDIPETVDLAVFTVPAPAVVDELRRCAEIGVGSAVVISAGFKELGERGRGLEEEMTGIARGAGMALVGPNGQGVCCPANSFFSWMPLFYPPGGKAGFVCQSGNILNMTIGHVLDSGFGVSKAVSSGNEALLRSEDYLEYLSEDPSTEVIAAYLEGVGDGRRFVEKAVTVTGKKPVVLLKGGRTSAGNRAAGSHTGAMAVPEDLFESACRQAGITLAGTVREAGLTAASFINRPLPRGRRIGIVTGGGGLGVLAADACSEHGLEVVSLSGETLQSIGGFLPDYWVPGNPIDLVAGLDVSVIKPILEILMSSGEVDAALFIFIESYRTGVKKQDGSERSGYDLSAFWDAATQQFGPALDELSDLSLKTGIPLYTASNFGSVEGSSVSYSPGEERPMIFPDVHSACSSIRCMVDYSDYRHGIGG